MVILISPCGLLVLYIVDYIGRSPHQCSYSWHHNLCTETIYLQEYKIRM